MTGWNFGITHNPTYAPSLPNYSGSATGRTFPSAAGFHTSQLFFTDDTGTYLLPSRDEHPRGETTLEDLAKLRTPFREPGTVTAGMGGNGGILSEDGPTFLCTLGWDWMPAMRDRDIGIWRKVTLSASGPVAMGNR